MYRSTVPRLWSETVEAHRRAVRGAVLEATGALVAARGLRSVTMTEIAAETGIGRATLYRYFPDVESILLAWHERRIEGHLAQLSEARDQGGDARRRLQAVLEGYALITHESHGHGDADLAAFLHRDEHLDVARRRLHAMVRDLVAEGAASGALRDDVAPDELATYCVHALAGARSLPSRAAVHRLVAVTLAGLRPPHAA